MAIEIGVEEVIRVATKHLQGRRAHSLRLSLHAFAKATGTPRDARGGFDELCRILEYISGANISYDPETNMITIDTATATYCGLFDKLQHDWVDAEQVRTKEDTTFRVSGGYEYTD